MQPRAAIPSSALPLPAGMNMSPVSRLKKTWAKVKTAKFFILEVSKVVGCLGDTVVPDTAAQLHPSLLPAPDGPNREFLQLQDSPARGGPPLPDRPQQPGEGRSEACPDFKALPCSRAPRPRSATSENLDADSRVMWSNPLCFYSICSHVSLPAGLQYAEPMTAPNRAAYPQAALTDRKCFLMGLPPAPRGCPLWRAVQRETFPLLPTSPSEPAGSPSSTAPSPPCCILVSCSLPTWVPLVPEQLHLSESLLFPIKLWFQVHRVLHLLILNSILSLM